MKNMEGEKKILTGLMTSYKIERSVLTLVLNPEVFSKIKPYSYFILLLTFFI